MSSTRIFRSVQRLGYGAVAWLGLSVPALAQTAPTRILFVGRL